MDVFQPTNLFGFKKFVVEVKWVAGRACRNVGRIVGSDDLRYILAILFFTRIGGCCCQTASGCCAGPLYPCVHIGFIVIANVNDVLIALKSSR